MRFKFRAWDKERLEMFPVKVMDWAEWWVSCDPTYNQVRPLKYGERNSFNNERTDRHILMQYTGFHDRNGKEIYIGDVVKLGESDELGEVIINDFMQIPVIDNNVGQVKLYKVYGNCRVIGNVYEMPDWNF